MDGWMDTVLSVISNYMLHRAVLVNFQQGRSELCWGRHRQNWFAVVESESQTAFES